MSSVLGLNAEPKTKIDFVFNSFLKKALVFCLKNILLGSYSH